MLQNQAFGQNLFNSMQSHFGNFFPKGLALLALALKKDSLELKNLFVLSSFEFLVTLKAKFEIAHLCSNSC